VHAYANDGGGGECWKTGRRHERHLEMGDCLCRARVYVEPTPGWFSKAVDLQCQPWTSDGGDGNGMPWSERGDKPAT